MSTEIEDVLKRALAHEHQFVDEAEAQNAVEANRVNRWLAVHITSAVGTMWCAYVFAAIALVSLPAAIMSRSPVLIVQWVSTTFLQLVLLSIIMVGQNVQSEASNQRAEADHESINLDHQILASLLQLQQQQMQQHGETLDALKRGLRGV